MVEFSTLPSELRRSRRRRNSPSLATTSRSHRQLYHRPPDVARVPVFSVRSGSAPTQLNLGGCGSEGSAGSGSGGEITQSAMAASSRRGNSPSSSGLQVTCAPVVTSPDRLAVSAPVVTAPVAVWSVLRLKPGGRVYWISDSGPEPALVRWLGRLPQEEAGDDWMVGVEFQRAVGSGNGCYRGRRLFKTRLGHASIVPIAGLIRAEDFEQNSDSTMAVATSILVDTKDAADDNVNTTDRNHSRHCELRCYSPRDGHDRLSDDAAWSRANLGSTSPLSDTSPSHCEAARCNGSVDCLLSLAKTSETDDKSPDRPIIRRGSFKLRKKLPNFTAARNALDLDRLRHRKHSKLQVNRCDVEECRSAACAPTRSTSSEFYVPLPVEMARLEDRRRAPGVGEAVQLDVCGVTRYGVIRWIGNISSEVSCQRFAGIETENDVDSGNDGCFRGQRYFTCALNKALFVPLDKVYRDSRFGDVDAAADLSGGGIEFGRVECPLIDGNVPPLVANTADEIKLLCGKSKGIQGHLNSCYLDATLFSMFAFTSVFDCLLYRPRRSTDIEQYCKVQKILRDEIVNPLRSAMFVRADKVMKLREKLASLSSVEGMTTEEKDPEELVQSLLEQILHADPFLRYTSGHSSYLYQLIVDKDERLPLPTVQQLFDQSFVDSGIKLTRIPSCFIIQMPRFGRDYKVYPRIVPSTWLDITDVLEDSPRQCGVCGALAERECRQCFGQVALQSAGQSPISALSATAFCQRCDHIVHKHPDRGHHQRPSRRLTVPHQFRQLSHFAQVPRHYLQLFAVVCIKTSHYVSFVRTGGLAGCVGSAGEQPVEVSAPMLNAAGDGWVFFDSMADRCGEKNGYNIPEVRWLPDLSDWLGDEGQERFLKSDSNLVPDYVQRLLSDGYMCFYQSRDVMSYQ